MNQKVKVRFLLKMRGKVGKSELPPFNGAYSAMCYSVISSGCYDVSDMSHGHNKQHNFCVIFQKISTGQKKLAPTGLHGLHVLQLCFGVTLQCREGQKEFGKIYSEKNWEKILRKIRINTQNSEKYSSRIWKKNFGKFEKISWRTIRKNTPKNL